MTDKLITLSSIPVEKDFVNEILPFTEEDPKIVTSIFNSEIISGVHPIENSQFQTTKIIENHKVIWDWDNEWVYGMHP